MMLTVAWGVSVDVELLAVSPMLDIELILSSFELEKCRCQIPKRNGSLVAMP